MDRGDNIVKNILDVMRNHSPGSKDSAIRMNGNHSVRMRWYKDITGYHVELVLWSETENTYDIGYTIRPNGKVGYARWESGTSVRIGLLQRSSRSSIREIYSRDRLIRHMG